MLDQSHQPSSDATASPNFEAWSDGAGTIVVRGELDACCAPRLRDAIASIEQLGDVDVDARELSFIDSSGIRALIESSNRVAQFGGTLSVKHAQPFVYRVLKITGLLQRLHVQPPSDPAL